MLRITVRTPTEPGRVCEFNKVQRVSFGRSSDSDVALEANYVSRHHGELILDQDSWYVLNQGSRANVVILRQGREIEVARNDREPVRHGDLLQILATCMEIEILNVEEFDFDCPSGMSFVDFDPLGSPLAQTQVSDLGSIRERLHEKAPKLNQLLELAKDLNALHSLSAILSRIAATVFDVLPCATHFSVSVPTDSDFEPIFGMVRQGSPNGEIAISQSILHSVSDQEMGMLFHGLDSNIDPSQSMIQNQIASSMAVPLMGSHGVVGVLQIDNRNSYENFSQDDLDFGILLARSAAYALERTQLQDDIQRMFEGFVGASVAAIESRDPTTSGHSIRVAEYSVSLAEAVSRTADGPLTSLRFSPDQLRELRYAALLHDFGKVGVKECVLVKSHRLYPEELERVEARFSLIRALQQNSVLQEGIQLCVGSDRFGEIMGSIDCQCREMGERIDEARQLIHEMNRAGPITEDQIERLRQIGRRSFTTEQGENANWLTKEELECLSIHRGTLNEEQRREIESHVTHGWKALKQIPWPNHLSQVPEIIRTHHEKLDGSGYPEGIPGQEISPQARLLAVVDIFDALTASDRPYRNALPVERGLDILRSDASAGKIDRDMVAVFIHARVWEHTRGLA